MTQSDKVGIGIIIGLMVLLGAVLVWTFRPMGNASRGFKDNVVVEQRLINLQKDSR